MTRDNEETVARAIDNIDSAMSALSDFGVMLARHESGATILDYEFMALYQKVMSDGASAVLDYMGLIDAVRDIVSVRITFLCVDNGLVVSDFSHNKAWRFPYGFGMQLALQHCKLTEEGLGALMQGWPIEGDNIISAEFIAYAIEHGLCVAKDLFKLTGDK